MNAEKLETFGFSETEASIYLALVQDGMMQAGEISKKTQINRRTTYDTLERLIAKGYVSYSITASKKVFKAADPKVIMDNIKEIEREAEQIIPKLKNIYEKRKPENRAETYRGRKGIRNILNELLEVDEYVGFGSNEKFPEIMKHDFAIFQKKKEEKGIKSKTLMSSYMKGKPILDTAKTEYRFLPDEFSTPTSTFIYGNKTAIIIWTQIPIGIVVESEEGAKAFKNYFDALWNIAEENNR